MRRAIEPKPFVLPLLSAAVMAALGSWLLVRRRGGPRAGGTGRPARAAWLAALALPLLAMPSRSAKLARPSAARESSGDAPNGLSPPLATDGVDLSRFFGTWFEIARLPNRYTRPGDGQASTTFTLRNRRIRMVSRWRTPQGRLRIAHGLARVVADSGGARLKVSIAPSWLRWLPLVWGDYWILHVDRNYSVALVGTPQRDALWLLSRQPEMQPDQAEPMLQLAKRQGYAVERIEFS